MTMAVTNPLPDYKPPKNWKHENEVRDHVLPAPRFSIRISRCCHWCLSFLSGLLPILQALLITKGAVAMMLSVIPLDVQPEFK